MGSYAANIIKGQERWATKGEISLFRWEKRAPVA
jgi:hypothetical protein